MARSSRASESSSDYWTSLGALTDQPRFILAKRPGIPDRRNLEQQRRSLEAGVVFHWLLYDSPAARELWPKYLNELRGIGIGEERLKTQLQCRVVPAELSVRSIDWRIAIFGDQIALCSYEPSHGAAPAGGPQTFTLDAPGDLQEKFAGLFAVCPDIDAAGAAPGADPGAPARAHTALKMAFLSSFKQGLPTDIMLHRLEDAAATSQLLLDQTRLLIWISVLTLVAVAATLALTQVKLP